MLLVLLPGCQWCDKNVPNRRALVESKGQSFRFVAVSLSPENLQQYLEASRLGNVPGILPFFDKNPTLNDITATPQSIVVAPGGEVQKVWLGAYDRETKREVEKFFKVSLPVGSVANDIDRSYLSRSKILPIAPTPLQQTRNTVVT